jgi:hypothetical protein
MTPSRTLATALRVLRQLRRDPRTIALLLVVPCVLMVIVDQLFVDQEEVFQSVGVPMLGGIIWDLAGSSVVFILGTFFAGVSLWDSQQLDRIERAVRGAIAA